MWDPRVVAPLDPEMVTDAANHRVVVTVEDGLRDGGAGDGIRDAIENHVEALTGERPACKVRVLGMPAAYFPHDKPAAILARYGLDASGIAAEATRALD